MIGGSTTDDCDSDITVVIATLGECTLESCIHSISRGSVIPRALLLCIPKELEYRVADFVKKYPFVRIVPTLCKGQVAQRLVGFKLSDTKYTLQLDSDTLVDKQMLESLSDSIANNPSSCVGPIIYRSSTQSKYSYLSSNCNVFKKVQKNILTLILNGFKRYQAGTISKGGIGFGPNTEIDTSLVEWLPGCCVMHHTKNLICENFYSRKGKAFAEDMYHSYYLAEKGVSMVHDSNAKVIVNFPDISDFTIYDLCKDQFGSFTAGIGWVRLADKSLVRYTLYFGVKSLFLGFNRIFRITKSP